MNYGLWLSAAGLQANEYRQSVLANNLANANTVGFKHDLALVQERRVESRTRGHRGESDRVLDELSGGNAVRRTYSSFEPGALEPTGHALDLALGGDGHDFFSVQDGGATRYTRDGRFAVNAEHELVMVAGGGRFKVLNESGQPVVLQGAEAGELRIDRGGTIRQGSVAIGRLGIVKFADTDGLSKAGANLFRADGATAAPSDAEVHAGMVERSTADPVAGLAEMIEASRAYQLNASLIQLQDQMTGQVIQAARRAG